MKHSTDSALHTALVVILVMAALIAVKEYVMPVFTETLIHRLVNAAEAK